MHKKEKDCVLRQSSKNYEKLITIHSKFSACLTSEENWILKWRSLFFFFLRENKN